MKTRGSILVGVLWCMVLLSLLVIGVLHTARMDLIVGKNYGDRVQAHYLALAGVERAKALLYQDVVTREHTSKNHTGTYYDDAKNFKDVALGRGKMRVFHRASQDDGGAIVYGISDEESRLDLNTVSANQLTNLSGMTPDILSAIIAWRTAATQNPSAGQDNNNTASGGAASDYYMSLRPPYMARNGPYQTVRELLMVRGVTTDLLLGNDNNQNGFLDENDEPASQLPPDAKPPQRPNPGWEPLLTVTDRDKSVDASGKDRLNPQTADYGALSAIAGVTPEIARAIMSYRNQHQLQNLDDLMNVTQSQGATNNANGVNNNNNSGATVISQDLFEQIADNFTFANGQQSDGLVNINTAGLDVLASLPGLDRTLAQAIINYRKSSGYFDNVAGILKVDRITRDIFKQLSPLITARSETFRIICEGKINSTGTRQRVEEIVHIGGKDIETLSYREDL
jgi:competence ComEA-like helix-hairpin-helix protein